MSLHAAHDLLRCPHCAADLTADGPRWRCPAGHSFDVAKQGYLNLANGPEPANADTPAMLEARARVQASGLFDVVSEALDQQVPLTGATTLLEAGAGTGHYLAGLVEGRPGARGLALDVSRAAARRASRAHHRVASVVADVWRGLPVRTASLDVVLCVFAPRNLAEFARVLRPDGTLLIATPTAGHLAELRERYGLLGIDDDKHDRLLAAASEYFAHEHTAVAKSLTSQVAAAVVDDLIGMGPNAFHNPPRAAGAETVRLAVRVSRFTPLAA
ncbi:putative RNA methyltransferase [Micropruina sp.]|uniref:putative RNA methyltransferase n=1 Tax=Micropruina sp. TaxID=2737536 RepID=UPI0039E67DF6